MMNNIAEVAIDLSEILEIIYAESAWICAYNDKYYRLTSDNRLMLRMRIGEGYARLRPIVAPHLKWANYNPNIAERSLVMQLQFQGEVTDELKETLHQCIAHLLAHYALMRFYDQHTDLYRTAFRRSRLQLKLLWARDANHALLN